MKHTYTLTSLSVIFGIALFSIAHGATTNVTYVKSESSESDETEVEESGTDTTVATAQAVESTDLPESDAGSSNISADLPESKPANEKPLEPVSETVHVVPFYSQFTDISAPEWRKIGCGIASLAMLIDFYKPEEITVDELLSEGINTGAYVSDAGWSHAGLIELGKDHGLSGEAVYMNDLTMTTAFSKLEEALREGPVMVSVHYTFEPTNPIPHLVIATGVEDGKVHYNDPAEKAGNGTVSIEQFKSAWKKRYIALRP